MSRDWTPRELVFNDYAMEKKFGENLRDREFTLHIDGETISLTDKELKQAYPNLYFVFGDNLKDIKRHNNLDNHTALLNNLEKDITQIIEFDKNNQFNKDINLSEISNSLIDWYKGDYCSHFYYNEENNTNLTLLIEETMKQGKDTLLDIHYDKLWDIVHDEKLDVIDITDNKGITDKQKDKIIKE